MSTIYGEGYVADIRKAKWPQPKVDAGVTHAQAMEIGRRFHEDSDAAPTIAADMGIQYDSVCAVLDGAAWPGSRRFWMDRVLP